MRHSVFGRKLSRTKNERKRLFTVLVRDLLIHDAIVTTMAKAKAVQPMVEKLITKAKADDEVHRRRVIAGLGNRELADKLIEQAKTRFALRTSGFTRIIKLGKRMGDATDTARLSFVDQVQVTEVIAPKKAQKNDKKPSQGAGVKTKTKIVRPKASKKI